MADITSFEGRKVGAGTFAKMYLDGEHVFDLKSLETRLVIDKEDVIQNGTRSKDSKQVTVGGEGTFVTHKIYSRGKELLDLYKSGKEVGFDNVLIRLEDPDMDGLEAIEIKRISLDEFTLLAGENASLMEEEFPFTFNPDHIKYKDYISR